MSFESKRSIASNIGSENNQNEILKRFCYIESSGPLDFMREKYVVENLYLPESLNQNNESNPPSSDNRLAWEERHPYNWTVLAQDVLKSLEFIVASLIFYENVWRCLLKHI